MKLIILFFIFYSVLSRAQVACGIKGTIEERIIDCSSQSRVNIESFILVTATKDNYEVRQK